MDALFYDQEINRFVNWEGVILHDLHQHFSTWELDQWKSRGQHSEFIIDKKGTLWEVSYFIDG